MKNIGMELNWHGRPYTVWSGCIRDLQQLIPTFTISDFSIGDGVNAFLSVIARKPLSEIVKCYRLFRPKFSKVKTSFFAQIPQVSNTPTPSEGVCDYTPV